MLISYVTNIVCFFNFNYSFSQNTRHDIQGLWKEKKKEEKRSYQGLFEQVLLEFL